MKAERFDKDAALLATYRTRILQQDKRLDRFREALEAIARTDLDAKYGTSHAVFTALKALKDEREDWKTKFVDGAHDA